ncbi:hypothetical protein BJY04DRAFT_229867 [Aspergillus karnatakaensis]|uniref:exoribonuclease II n=1 Tax=Aspergillus karnatakaensis TaxID=1810916 RepID=UPI003CCCAF62
MPLISLTARARSGVADLVFVSSLRRSLTSASAGVFSRPGNNRAFSVARRDLLRTTSSFEDLRLQAEFDQKKDVRRYLGRWQELNPNTLDPVNRSEANVRPQQWVGNMYNDNRETYDAGGDTVRLTDEDMSDFVDIADEGEGIHDYLEPGDLVAISTSNELVKLAIYVRSVNKQQQFYTSRGKWRIAYTQDLDYVIKGFTTPESVAPLLPHFPDSTAELNTEMQSQIEGGVPRAIGADLLQKMNDFSSQSQELYRANAMRFDKIYDLLADEEQRLEMTLEELACKALGIQPGQLNDVILFAVHEAVRRNPFLVESDRSSLFTNHYVVNPTGIARLLQKVTTWVHEHQDLLVRAAVSAKKDTTGLRDHPVQKFVQKAQRLIRQNRNIRAPTTMATVGPSSHRFSPGQDDRPEVFRELLTESFTFNDKLILKFLQLWCIPPRRMTSGTLRSAGSHIMRSTGMYSQLDLSEASGPLFLQEIGVFKPWENIRLLDKDLALPGHGLNPVTDSNWEAVEEACQKLDSPLEDRMAKMRKDWGNLPVYCIDDANAQEIDDGVSLERIPGSDDTFWIRIHVANPTAFIDSEHMIMQHAASRIQTLYTPDRTYPMIPKALTQEHFSLAPGRPSLTFSAKMNLKGEILETDVTHGTVRNVISITHGRLRQVFGVKEDETLTPLVVGGDPLKPASRPELRDTLTPEDEDTFHTLRQLMLAYREQRIKNGAMEHPPHPSIDVSISVGNAPLPPSKLEVEDGRAIVGDPIIQLQQKNFNPHEISDMSKHNLVSLLMNLGCWVSAKWCAERNIPAVYDGTYYHPEYPHLTRDNMSHWGGQGFFRFAPPKGVSLSRPLHHTPLGLDAYIKSTSPLRRYTDVIAHHQIEAAIRFEHELGRRIDASTEDASALPFSHEQVDNFITQSLWKRNRLRSCEQASKQFWACMLLFRAFYFSEAELPETFECLIHRPLSQTALAGTQFDKGFTGVITSLGVRCQITAPPEFGEIDPLSIVDAKIVAVNLSRLAVVMEATKVVRPFTRVGEWA